MATPGQIERDIAFQKQQAQRELPITPQQKLDVLASQGQSPAQPSPTPPPIAPPGPGQIERDIATQNQQAPAPGGGGDPAADFSTSLGNIIQTGSSAAQQATLMNPQTGERQVVDVGSPEAQQLFGQGFVLQGADGQPTADASASVDVNLSGDGRPGDPSGPPDRLSFLRSEGDRIRAQAFSSVYGHTPDEWQDLPPSTQRQLRNQRVQGLAGQLGNINSAIQTVKEEMETTRDTALENLNLAMQFGVTDQMDADELQKISDELGLSPDVIKSFGSQTEPPELRSVGGSLYAIQFNPETGAFESQLVIGKPASGGGGGGGGGFGGSKDFNKRADELRKIIQKADDPSGTFINSFNSLQGAFPEASDAQIDAALGGSFAGGTATGTAAFSGEGGGNIDSLLEETLRDVRSEGLGKVEG